MSINRTLLANYLQGTQDPAKRNYILNHSAFKDLSNINAVGATVVRNTTAPLTAISDIQATFTGASQYVDVLGTALDRAIRGTNCELRFNYKLNLGTGANVEVQVMDGVDVLTKQQLLSESSNRPISINFPCSNTGNNYSVRFIQSSGSTTSVLNVANIYLGQATNVGTVAQAEFVGTVKVTGCSGLFYAPGAYSDFSPLSGCTYNIEGTGISAPASNLPGFRITGKPGIYKILVSGQFESINAWCGIRLVNDSNVAFEESGYGYSGANGKGSFVFTIKSESALNNDFFRIQMKGGSGCFIQTSASYPQPTFTVYRYPLQSEIAYRPEQTRDFYGIIITSNTDTYSNIATSSYNIAQNSNIYGISMNGSGPVGIACADTTPSVVGNMSCTSGNGAFGITAIINQPGLYEVCFSPQFQSVDSADRGSLWKIALTENNSNTILIDGDNIIATRYTGGYTTSSFGCNVFDIKSIGQKTFKFFFAQYAAGNRLRFNNLFASNSAYIKKISPSISTPNLIGSITSTSTDSFREVSFAFGGASFNSVCSSSPCTIYNQTGGVASVTRTGAGDYTISFDSNLFKSQPVCTFTPSSSGSVVASTRTSFTLDNTTYRVITEDLSGTPTDSFVLARCVGPRGSL